MRVSILRSLGFLVALALVNKAPACETPGEARQVDRECESTVGNEGRRGPVELIYYIEEQEEYKHFEIKEFDVERKEHRTVGEFEPVGILWSVAISRDGKYFFYARAGKEKQAVGILGRDNVEDVFRKVAEVPLEDKGVILSLIYDDWEDVLYIYYGRYPDDTPEDWWLPPIVLTPCKARIDMRKSPYEMKTYTDFGEGFIMAISQRYIYTTKGVSGGTTLSRIDRTDRTSTELLFIPTQKTPYELIVLKPGDKYVVETMISEKRGDSTDCYAYVYINKFPHGRGAMTLGEPVYKTSSWVFLNAVQPPGRRAIILEDKPHAGEDSNYFRVFLLDLVNYTVERVFEQGCSPSIYTRVIAWLRDPADFDPRAPSNAINHRIKLQMLPP
jgi:hypothetical protein